jgi:hypothetical protein
MQKLLDSDSVKIDILRYRNDGLSYKKIEELTGVSKTRVQEFLAKKTYKQWWSENEKPIAAGSKTNFRHNIKRAKGSTFIITSAQNNTYVHGDVLKTLELIAKHNDAQIIVGTFSYNKNGFQNLQKSDGDWFDPKIEDYIVDEPLMLSDKLIYCGELNILPTAENPLSGFHSYTKDCSGIIPHAKVQLETLPRHKSESHTRMLYTTGAITLQNYIQKTSGQKASFHHIFGALIVEIDLDGDHFVRQLIADSSTGHIQDLDVLYTPDGYFENQRVEAINWGDIHVEKKDDVVYNTSFYNKDSMFDVLKPRYQFCHDTGDGEARNHHNISDPYFRFKAYTTNKDFVEDNIRSVGDFLASIERSYCTTVVVESNHDTVLQRWLKSADYKTDPANALFFLDCQYRTYQSIHNGEEDFSVFEYAVKKYTDAGLSNVIFLREDDSFTICGDIECGMHGHNGTNGAKGSVAIFKKLGTRCNIGHSHTPTIKDGVYYAGVTAKLDQGYNKTATTWAHSHIVTYPTGKRTIVTIVNGKWRRN